MSEEMHEARVRLIRKEDGYWSITLASARDADLEVPIATIHTPRFKEGYVSEAAFDWLKNYVAHAAALLAHIVEADGVVIAGEDEFMEDMEGMAKYLSDAIGSEAERISDDRGEGVKH